MICDKCGAELKSGTRLCKKCGTLVVQKSSKEKPEKHINSKWILSGIAGIVVLVGVVSAIGGVMGSKNPHDSSTEAVKVSETMCPEETVQPTDDVQEVEDFDAEEQAEEEEPAEEQEEKVEPAEEQMEEEEPEEELEAETEAVAMSYLYSVRASSELSERGMTHSVERIYDGRLNQAWVEGAPGQGIGESVTFTFDNIYKFSGIKVYAGYQKTRDLYRKNSRPKKITFKFSDGSRCSVNLKDHYGMQNINFDKSIEADEVKIIIDSVYKGTKYTDTVISEVEWY